MTKLWPHQSAACKWLDLFPNALLDAAMGTGKSLITIETILNADRTIPKGKKDKVMDILLDRTPTPSPKKKRLISTNQAAEILQIHVATVREYARKGVLTPIRFSARKIRFDLDEIEFYASGDLRNAPSRST